MTIDNIPLDVLKVIDKLLKESKSSIVRVKDDDVLLHIKLKNINYDFYFKIIKIRIENNQTIHTVEIKPSSNSNPNFIAKDILLGELEKHFSSWLSIAAAYSQYDYLEIYDSEIESLVEKLNLEFDFEINDSDKNSSVYNLKTQIKLFEYLDFVIEKTNEFTNDENSEIIKEIEIDTKELQSLLPKLTKQQFLDKLKSIWAKCWTVSVKLIKEIVIKAATEIIVKSLYGDFPNNF